MGLPVYTAQVIRCAFQGTVGGRNWANIMHYKYAASAPSIADLTEMAAALVSEWGDGMQALQDPDTTLVTIKLTDLTSGLAAQVEQPAGLTGTREGTILPASASVLATYPIDYRYRGGHPRNYLSVGVETDLDTAQTWSLDFVNSVLESWNNVVNLPVGLTYGATSIVSNGFIQLQLHDTPFTEGVYYPFPGPPAIGQQTIGTIKRRIRRGARRR
jgi:hypothetical protein